MMQGAGKHELEMEYDRLRKGLREASETDLALVNPVLPVDVLNGKNLLSP